VSKCCDSVPKLGLFLLWLGLNDGLGQECTRIKIVVNALRLRPVDQAVSAEVVRGVAQWQAKTMLIAPDGTSPQAYTS
jgi:hypothetical protein